MKKPDRRPTLRARRMDFWRRLERFRMKVYAVDQASRAAGLYRPRSPIIALFRKMHEKHELQLFGRKEAVYRKLARS